MAKEIGIPSDDFHSLKEYHFYLHNKFRKNRKVSLLKSPSFMLGRKGFFYLSKKGLKKLFMYLVEESGQYVKVDKQSAEKTIDQGVPSIGQEETTIISPKFSL